MTTMIKLVGGPNTGSRIPSSPRLEVGKIYKLRDGRRYRLVAADNGQLHAVYQEED
jgi:hypothetical protein